MEMDRVERTNKAFCANSIQLGGACSDANKPQAAEKAKRRDSFWAATPFLIVVTVLTPATTWTEGFTNRLIGTDYSEKCRRWQPRKQKFMHVAWPKSVFANVRKTKAGWERFQPALWLWLLSRLAFDFAVVVSISDGRYQWWTLR
jgi:hypothetical protein